MGWASGFGAGLGKGSDSGKPLQAGREKAIGWALAPLPWPADF